MKTVKVEFTVAEAELLSAYLASIINNADNPEPELGTADAKLLTALHDTLFN